MDLGRLNRNFDMSEHGKRLVFTSGVDGGIYAALGPLIDESDIRKVLVSMLQRWPAELSIHQKWVSEGAVRPTLHNFPCADVWIIPCSCVDRFDVDPGDYADNVPSIQGLALDGADTMRLVIEFWKNSI